MVAAFLRNSNMLDSEGRHRRHHAVIQLFHRVSLSDRPVRPVGPSAMRPCACAPAQGSRHRPPEAPQEAVHRTGDHSSQGTDRVPLVGRADGCRPSQGGRTLRGSGWDGCIAWFTGWEEQSWKRPCRSGLRAVRPGSPSYRAPRRASTAKSARRTRYAERGALRRSDAVQANGPRRRARASRVRRARCGPNARAPRGSARAARGQRGRRGHTGTFPRRCRAGCAMRPPRAPAGRRTAGRRTSRGG